VSIAYVSAIIEADIDTVWSVLHDFHGIDGWVRRIRSAEPEDGAGPAAVGSTRRLTMQPDGRVVRERLVHYDAPGHRYSYEFVGDQPFPVRAYRGTVHLLPVTLSGTTFVEWYGDFDCDAAVADRLATTFTGLYAEFLDDLRAHLAGMVFAAGTA
jgi:polyketide cyclase/dehydrase/lipid transport protein